MKGHLGMRSSVVGTCLSWNDLEWIPDLQVTCKASKTRFQQDSTCRQHGNLQVRKQ